MSVSDESNFISSIVSNDLQSTCVPGWNWVVVKVQEHLQTQNKSWNNSTSLQKKLSKKEQNETLVESNWGRGVSPVPTALCCKLQSLRVYRLILVVKDKV